MNIHNYSYNHIEYDETELTATKYKITETYKSYSYRERIHKISKIITNPCSGKLWKNLQNALLGYKTLSVNKEIISCTNLPPSFFPSHVRFEDIPHYYGGYSNFDAPNEANPTLRMFDHRF